MEVVDSAAAQGKSPANKKEQSVPDALYYVCQILNQKNRRRTLREIAKNTPKEKAPEVLKEVLSSLQTTPIPTNAAKPIIEFIYALFSKCADAKSVMLATPKVHQVFASLFAGAGTNVASLKKFKAILAHVSPAAAVEELKNTKDWNVVEMLVGIVAPTETKSEFFDVLFNKIKEEIMNAANRQLKTLPTFNSIKQVLQTLKLANAAQVPSIQAGFQAGILSPISLLIKRDETNIHLLNNVLPAGSVGVDLGQGIIDFVTHELREVLSSKNELSQENAIEASMSLIAKTPKVTAQCLKFVDELKSTVSAFTLDSQRFPYVSIVKPLCTLAGHEDSELAKQLRSKLFSFLVDALAHYSHDERIFKLEEAFDELISAPKFENATFPLESKDVAFLNKTVDAGTIAKVISAKAQYIVACSVLERLIKKKFEVEGSDNLAATISKNIINPFIKTPEKMNTLAGVFLAAMSLYAVVFDHANPEEEANDDIKLLIGLLYRDSVFLTTQRYVEKINKFENYRFIHFITAFGAQHLDYFTSEEGVEAERDIFNYLWATLLIKDPISNEKVVKLLAGVDASSRGFLINSFIWGVIFQLYFNVESHPRTSDRLRAIIKFVVTHDNEDPVVAYVQTHLFIAAVSCPLVNREEVMWREVVEMLEKPERESSKTSLVSCINDEEEAIRDFLFTSHFAFNKTNPQLRELGVNALLFIVRLTGLETPLDELIDLAQTDSLRTNSERTDEWEEKKNERDSSLNTRFDNIEKNLTTMEFYKKVISKQAQEEEEKAAAAKKASKKAGKGAPEPKKQVKQEILDEQEIIRRRIQELIDKILPAVEILTQFSEEYIRLSRNHAGEGLVYRLIFPCIRKLGRERPEFRTCLFRLLHTIFKYSDKEFVRRMRAFFVPVFFEIICDMHSYNTDDQKMLRCLSILAKHGDFADVSLHFTHILIEFFENLLKEENVDSPIKNACYDLLQQLVTSTHETESKNEILGLIWPIITATISHTSTYDHLERFLVELIKASEADTSLPLIDSILGLADSVKIAILRAFDKLTPKWVDLNYERQLKFGVLTRDRNGEISALAKKLMEHYKMNLAQPKEFTDLDLYKFFIENPKDSIDILVALCKEILDKHVECREVFILRYISCLQQMFKENTNEETILIVISFFRESLPYIPLNCLHTIFRIFVESCCRENTPTLMEKTVELGIDIIKHHGSVAADSLIDILQGYLEASAKPEHQISAIIFLGVCAPYLKNKSSLTNIADKIVNLAYKSSETVQRSLAKGLSELLIFFEKPADLAKSLIDTVIVTSKDISLRRGAAYITSGIIKGLGIKNLESLKVLEFLNEKIPNQKEIHVKEGCLLLIQALLNTMDKLLEPYMYEFLKMLLNFFAEQREDLRTASPQSHQTSYVYPQWLWCQEHLATPPERSG